MFISFARIARFDVCAVDLPRLAGSDVLVQAIRDGVELLTWPSDTFAYAESYDEGRLSHLATCFRATSASLDAVFHVPEFLAVRCALVANLGAFFAEMLGVLRIHQHEVCSGAADFCASCHQAKVFRFDMLAACLKAMGHCHAETRLVATQTLLNASRGILVVVTHGDILAIAINATKQNASVHADP